MSESGSSDCYRGSDFQYNRRKYGEPKYNSSSAIRSTLPNYFGPSRDSRKLTRDNYSEIEKRVLSHFGKKFSFDAATHKWKLPEPDQMFKSDVWMDECLQQMKDELNSVKSKLNDYDLGDWHKHTRDMNMASFILKTLKSHIHAEFVTQAWCKFYEILASYNVIPLIAETSGRFNSLHLCEAPGAFIAALNHYLKLNKKNLNWKWLSTTLNPYYEGNPLSYMINDDRFILHTLKNWTFGADFTGNLMDLQNMNHIVEESRKLEDVLLVTADGSIDCQEDPGEQEQFVSSLHYCEAVTALHTLAEGGSFILKIFTIYEHETICLLYLLCCAFNDVHIYKPATSKEGNSEVYVVCLKYFGAAKMEAWLKILRQYYGEKKPLKAMFARQIIPENFIQKVHSCAKMFKNLQVAVIERNIAVFEGDAQPYEFSRKLRDMVTQHYIDHCKLAKLKNNDFIVGKDKLLETVALNVGPKIESGSFNDRCKKRELSPSRQLTSLVDEVKNLEIDWPFSNEDIKWLSFPQKSVRKFDIQRGKPIHTVESSKFCMGPLMRIYNQALKIAYDKFDSGAKKRELRVVQNMIHDKYPELFAPKRSPKICDFGESLWTAMTRGQNTEASRDALFDIADEIEDLWRGDSLILLGYPLLTQLHVGIVYLLSHIFEKVGFTKPHKQDFALIFYGYNSGSHALIRFIDKLCSEMTRLEDEGDKRAVLAIIPISILCAYEQEEMGDQNRATSNMRPGSAGSIEDTNDEYINENPLRFANAHAEFHKCVTHTNNLCLKEQVFDIVNNVLETKCLVSK